jgi:hypothetical protein
LAFGEAHDKPTPEDFPKLAGVLDTNDNFALASAATALQQAEIIFDVVPITDPSARLRAENPKWWIRPTRILVSAEDEAEARILVEPFQQPVSDTLGSRRSAVFPDSGRSSDFVLWHGSPNPPRVQRIGAWVIGSVFMVVGLVVLSAAVMERVAEGFSISVVIEAVFALAIVAAGIRIFRNGFPKRPNPAVK